MGRRYCGDNKKIAVMNDKGKVLENSRINNSLKQVGRFFDENINDEKVRVVMESSSVWYNIYSYLSEERHLNVVLSNPVKTRAIASAKIKTDKLDAAKLADLLRGGYVAECYVPDRRIMDLRELVRHRTVAVLQKADGKTYDYIARETRVHIRTAKKWVGDYIKNGIKGLKIRENHGGPKPRITDEGREAILSTYSNLAATFSF
jgi:hypothetical protein